MMPERKKRLIRAKIALNNKPGGAYPRRLALCLVRENERREQRIVENGIVENGASRFSVIAETFERLPVDRNLSYQQDLRKVQIPVLVLCAPSNRFVDLEPVAGTVLDKLSKAIPGKATIIVLS